MSEAEQAIANFVHAYKGQFIQSTSAVVVNYSGVVYNVEGSTGDPKINGASWKGLLQANGINGPCYVTAPAAGGHTHDQFNVGGHMTLNADGSVLVGGSCLLMPLCSGHNSTSMNRTPFQHQATTMLQLNGYMQMDIALTFMARMDENIETSMIYKGVDQSWNLAGTKHAAQNIKTLNLDAVGSSQAPEQYVTFHRVIENGKTGFRIGEVTLPSNS